MKKIIRNLYLRYKFIASGFAKRKIKTCIISLFFCLLALLTMNSYIVFSICSLLAIIIGIKSIKKKQKFGFLTILFSLILIITNINSNLIVENKNEKNKNVLIGNWIYNDSGGTYNFEENMTYTQYVSSNMEDNFCYGTYVYEYGYETDKGKLITKDVDFMYYKLILKPKKCIIEGKEDKSEESKREKHMVFAYEYNNQNKSVIINTTTDLYNNLTKKED